MNKPIGRPRVGTADNPVVQLTITVTQADAAYLASISRNLSKAVRQIIKERNERNNNDHH